MRSRAPFPVLIYGLTMACCGSGWSSARDVDGRVADARHPAGSAQRPEAGGASDISPEGEWLVATPESRGLSGAGLEAAAAYALRHGGGSGCVIRHGRLVKEWGPVDRRADIKSCTKGTLGATILGLAVDDGLVRLDDLARIHYPPIGAERAENKRRGWLERITIRHLATMTAGFDDGRPPLLVYEPGTKGIYSNDTSNMLAELLTLKFQQDLRAVVQKRVLEPIGVPADAWRWRDNVYRPKSIRGLASREFASGLTITHRALARVGYLYLRGGSWRGRQIVSTDYIRQATRPTELPSFVPYYAFYWASNARGTYPEIPADCYWALGLGDSFVLVCPSLDIVAVRLGVGSKASQLAGGDGPSDWGARVAGFFRLVVAAVPKPGAGDGKLQSAARPESGPRLRGENAPKQRRLDERPATPSLLPQTTKGGELTQSQSAAQAPRNDTAAPYPPSPVIRGISWAPSEAIRRQAQGSDNWPLTWADDDCLYTAYGDGNGFEPRLPEKLSLGFTRVAGGPEDFAGCNIRAPTGESKGDGAKGRKASGLLMVDGVLYLWVRNVGNSQLACSADHAKTWTWCDWKFTESFGCPTFLNFGKNYAGARDGYVYVYSHDSGSAYAPADRMVLARAPKDRLRQREAYEFLRATDDAGDPVWTKDIDERGAVFVHRGNCYRSGISFHSGLARYLWCQTLPGSDARFRGGFGIFDAPEPWGPWTTVYFTTDWDTGPGESSSFPTKWMNADGKTLHLVFSGEDSFSVRRAVMTLRTEGEAIRQEDASRPRRR